MNEYTIEALDERDSWFILGSRPTSGEAQTYMHNCRRMFPMLPLRVVENPSRVLITCNDPTGEAWSKQ